MIGGELIGYGNQTVMHCELGRIVGLGLVAKVLKL